MKTTWVQRWSEDWGRLPTERELREFDRYAIRWAVERGVQLKTTWREQIKRDKEAVYRRNNSKQKGNTPMAKTESNKAGIEVKTVTPTVESRIEELKAQIAVLKVNIVNIRAERDHAQREASEARRAVNTIQQIAKLCAG